MDDSAPLFVNLFSEVFNEPQVFLALLWVLGSNS